MSDDKPQHSGGFSGNLSAVRAGAVLIAFIIGVAILVAVGTRPTVTSPTSGAQTTVPPASTTTTTAAGGTTTTAAGGATTTTVAAAGGASTTTTARSRHHGAAATTTTVAHGSVSVVVANATNTSGLAAHYTTVIGNGGWAMKTPVDASTTEATSAVYFAAGQQQAATQIATAIGVKAAQVQPLTTSTPVSGVAGTDVVVVIGQDLANTAAGT
ncbi:MAG TPA: LytR C-terminal domain-containing protein [Acidimicrobiales bacterium]|nr:LytR C-terminal domain-containing protein [Acidimicrobiales bacterium]